jgi:hypothetical protein
VNTTQHASILLPDLPAATPVSEAVLFGFDDRAFPYQNNVETHLIPAKDGRIFLRGGPEGSHDEVVLYYGTVIRIGDTLHMWYIGNYGPLQNTVNYERVHCCICYATSKDGFEWTKPELNLVEFNGSKKNNICEISEPTLWSTCAIIHEPEEPDPARRFKMAYEAVIDGRMRFCVAFSADGLRWKPYEKNPVGPFLEMSGVTKHRGLYYVNGQNDLGAQHRVYARRLATFASADFIHWSPCGATGLDRTPDVHGPSMEDALHSFEEIHLGAAMWNRGNVIVGLYGMWHGHPSGDRALVIMDLGLALSHDALHYHEPIPNFRIIPAREHPERPLGFGASLMQGQGMENIGDQTLYWYSLWRGGTGNGVRVAKWERDRLGMLQPFRKSNALAVSCPVQIVGNSGSATATVNVSGLAGHSELRVALLDHGFRPITSFGYEDAEPITTNAFDAPLRWRGNAVLPRSDKPIRLGVQLGGIRPEDARLHAIYLTGAQSGP